MDKPVKRGLLADALDWHPRQGPPEPDSLKIARLTRENEALKRNSDLLLKSRALEHLDDEQFLLALGKLRERLGVDTEENSLFSDQLLLQRILPEVQEFKRKGGRPKASRSMDYERYVAVLRYKRENPRDNNCDDITAIRQLLYGEHRLFAGHKEESLVISVSKGKKSWNEAVREVEETIAKEPEAADFFHKRLAKGILT